jgi:hypothetical protein
MNYLMLDTSVWISLTQCPMEFEILRSLRTLIDLGRIVLVVSDMVKKEFDNNRANITGKVIKAYRSHIKNTRYLGELFSAQSALNKPLLDIE